MKKTKAELYFEDKDIDVLFNTLGATEELVTAYVRDTQKIVDEIESKQSEYAKHKCYNLFYDIEFRTKYTGFEHFDQLVDSIRPALILKLGARNHITPTLILGKVENEAGNYKAKLKAYLSKIDKPIFLYLSGGIDSELVALALIDAGIKFTPVIFGWTDNSGTSHNYFDIKYSMGFCNKHGLTPVIQYLNIEKLWASDEFLQFAEEIEMISPHLVTHAVMIERISSMYPNVKHLMGGEVRYHSDYSVDGIEIANLVLLAKVPATSLGYNNLTYNVFADSSSVGDFDTYLFYKIDGTWLVGSQQTVTGAPLSGTWTTTPGVAYEYNISSMTIINDAGPGSTDPTSAPSTFKPINVDRIICSVTCYYDRGTSSACQFTINVRKIGTSSPVVTSVITIGAIQS